MKIQKIAFALIAIFIIAYILSFASEAIKPLNTPTESTTQGSESITELSLFPVQLQPELSSHKNASIIAQNEPLPIQIIQDIPKTVTFELLNVKKIEKKKISWKFVSTSGVHIEKASSSTTRFQAATLTGSQIGDFGIRAVASYITAAGVKEKISANIPVRVRSKADSGIYSLNVSPANIQIPQGGNALFSVNVQAAADFREGVELTLSGPSFISVEAERLIIDQETKTNIRLVIPSDAPLGSYVLTIRGISLTTHTASSAQAQIIITPAGSGTGPRITTSGEVKASGDIRLADAIPNQLYIQNFTASGFNPSIHAWAINTESSDCQTNSAFTGFRIDPVSGTLNATPQRETFCFVVIEIRDKATNSALDSKRYQIVAPKILRRDFNIRLSRTSVSRGEVLVIEWDYERALNHYTTIKVGNFQYDFPHEVNFCDYPIKILPNGGTSYVWEVFIPINYSCLGNDPKRYIVEIVIADENGPNGIYALSFSQIFSIP